MYYFVGEKYSYPVFSSTSSLGWRAEELISSHGKNSVAASCKQLLCSLNRLNFFILHQMTERYAATFFGSVEFLYLAPDDRKVWLTYRPTNVLIILSLLSLRLC